MANLGSLFVLLALAMGALFVTEPFEGTYWKLTLLNGSAVATSAKGREPHLIFQKGHLAGFDGCNRVYGSYKLENDTIRFTKMGGTLKACAEPVRDREFIAVLEKAAKWRTLGPHLELRSSQDDLLARFEAVRKE